jgi:bifunctional UDP-N-acetylglucosamine pyrophosphorylase/glucosamine-1-phosphate N-acetyltransferase
MSSTAAVILAAGQGKRMKSVLPKVLHRCAGAPLIRYVLDAVASAGVEEVVIVIGTGASLVRETLGDNYKYALQDEQRGTGDALARALPQLSGECRDLLVLCGDTPLLTPGSLTRLLEARRYVSPSGGAPTPGRCSAGSEHLAHSEHPTGSEQPTGSEYSARSEQSIPYEYSAGAGRSGAADACILTSIFEDPSGYGRIVRDASGLVTGIVEDGDATPSQREIKEINTGAYSFDRQALEEALAGLKPDNRQGEYYLTDVIAILRQSGRAVAACQAPAGETAGINTRRELAAAERILRRRECERLMDSGVTIIDPAVTYIDHGVEVGQDTVIHPFCFLEGYTRVGPGCQIGPGARLVSTILGSGVTVQSSLLVESIASDGCQIGPFAYLRPGTVLAERVKVGDFVELKKTQVGPGSKIPHLSYVGDTIIGSGVNVGAGTITCNYDGVKKHVTRIGDEAFIGSNTNLVAPVSIGPGAVTGAGSTITRDVPEGALAVERSRQEVVTDWRRRKGRGQKDRQGTENQT